MAGFMRKTAVYLGLVEDDEERYDEEYPTEAPERPAPRAYPEPARPARQVQEAKVTGLSAKANGAPASQPTGGDVAYRITTLHPRTYNEARTIGENFRDGTPVIMNLTEMDDTDAKRLVDFAAGLIFGLRGSIERVTNKVFLLTPHNIEVTAEDKARIAEGGFFNQS
jgi:cell division inhibitor SepF